MIVDSIQDWRDPNEEHRLNGAESDYYLGLTRPLPLQERRLRQRGRAPPGARASPGRSSTAVPKSPGLAEYLTVFGTGAINVNTASPVVLRALWVSLRPRWRS